MAMADLMRKSSAAGNAQQMQIEIKPGK
jgi:hypothetical protein